MNGSLELAASDIEHFTHYIVGEKRYGKSSMPEYIVLQVRYKYHYIAEIIFNYK